MVRHRKKAKESAVQLSVQNSINIKTPIGALGIYVTFKRLFELVTKPKIKQD
jgi:hypothetical protein